MSVRRLRRTRTDDAREGQWLLTYSDMITLLLTFFIMLFAYSSLDAQKFEALVTSLQGSLGILDGGKSIIPDEGLLESTSLMDEAAGILSPGRNPWLMYDTLLTFIADEGLDGTVSVEFMDSGIVVRFSDQVLFDLGEAELKPEFRATLARFAEALAVWEGEIRVEGHSDSLPIHRPKFPSNWELSAARASTVVRFLIDRGLNPEQLSVAGYGEYRPIADNSTPEGRARNRRVDVVLLAEPETVLQGLSVGQ